MPSNFNKFLYIFIVIFSFLVSLIEVIAYNQFRIGFILFNVLLFIIALMYLEEQSHIIVRTTSYKLKDETNAERTKVIRKEKNAILFPITAVLIICLLIIQTIILFWF